MEQTNQPNAVTKAEFARMKSINRATVTRWGDAQRIVLNDDGLVLVAESEARLAETADPAKAGVVKRHEQERGTPVTDLLTPEQKAARPRSEKSSHYNDRIREAARHEAAKAENAELDLAIRKGELTDIEGVRKAMTDFATLARQAYERIAHDLKLRVAVETDPDKVFTILKTAVDDASRNVAELLKAQIDAAANTRQ